MDWIKEFGNEYEKPLDKLSDGISNTAIFRSIAFIGDSLSSGEFETVDADGIGHYYDVMLQTVVCDVIKKDRVLHRRW